MAGLAFLAVYICFCLASILAQIPALILAMTSVAAVVLMAAHVAQAVCRIGAGIDPDSAPEAVSDGLMLDATHPASSPAQLASVAPLALMASDLAELAAHLVSSASDVDPPLLY